MSKYISAASRAFKELRHEVIVHEPEVLDQREIFRLHHGCKTPSPRLAGDGFDSIPIAFMCGLRHVILSRFSFRDATPPKETAHIIPHFHERVLNALKILWNFNGFRSTVSSCANIHLRILKDPNAIKGVSPRGGIFWGHTLRDSMKAKGLPPHLYKSGGRCRRDNAIEDMSTPSSTTTPPKPSALFCCNDRRAFQVLNVCRAAKGVSPQNPAMQIRSHCLVCTLHSVPLQPCGRHRS